MSLTYKPYPYNKGAQLALRYGYGSLFAPRLTAAAKVLQAAWRYKRQAFWLARHTPEAFRGLKRVGHWRRAPPVKRLRGGGPTKFARRMVTEHKQLSEARQDPIVTPVNVEQIKLNNLYLKVLEVPDAQFNNAGGQDILHRRIGLAVYLKGVRICRDFYLRAPGGESTPSLNHVTVHYAIIQLKQADIGPIDWKNEVALSFFRLHTDDVDNHTPFVDNGAASQWTNTSNCHPMNPKQFTVITHMKRRMEQRRTGSVEESNMRPSRYHWKIRKYMKINRKLTYSNINSRYNTHPILEVIWYQTETPDGYPSGLFAADGEYLSTWAQNTMYYRNICC